VQTARFPLAFVRRALKASVEEIDWLRGLGVDRRCAAVGRYMTECGLATPSIAQGLGRRGVRAGSCH
jgi:hypothetical protein